MKKKLSYSLFTLLFVFLCGCTTPALQQNEQPVSDGKVTEGVEKNDETKNPIKLKPGLPDLYHLLHIL